MARLMYRQGDILFIRRGEETIHFGYLGEESPHPIVDRLVVALGEATGHAHAIVGAIRRIDIRGTGFPSLIEVLEPSTVVHEEHGPIALEPGFYDVVQQLEYTPRSWRNVRD